VFCVVIAKKNRAKEEEKRDREKKKRKTAFSQLSYNSAPLSKKRKRDKVIRRHELTLLSLSFQLCMLAEESQEDG
jgi:hypothetical protein